VARILDDRSSIQHLGRRTIERIAKSANPKMTEWKENASMNAIAREKEESKEFDELKTRLKATWMTGDYDLFSRFMEKDAEQFFRRLQVKPGTRLLDVGCGAGQLALIAARAGAQVVGCDIATNWIEKARARAAAEGLEVTFEEGMPNRSRMKMLSLT
jgi:2-polyprenyl-3-methyl-5-hydroxy-6-metoxy-1,4-benzoquinol methylase